MSSSKFVNFNAQRYLNVLKLYNKADTERWHLDRFFEHAKSFELIPSTIEYEEVQLNGKRIFDERFLKIDIYKNNKYVHISKPSALPPPPNKALLDKILKKDFKVDIDKFHQRVQVLEKAKRPPRPPRGTLPREIFLKDISTFQNASRNIQQYSYILTAVIDGSLLWFYIFLYRKLQPLKKLKNEITQFSKGNLDICTKTKGKDEISEVSNEFNSAILKIRELRESRNLFLRNIMHELKTPIAKGKLISDTLQESRRKEILQRAFLRLEYLLGEFAKIEELTSGYIILNKKEFRVVDLIDQSLDILLLDETKVDIHSVDVVINVDFELFSIALKNLIDNAIKYNTNGNPEIFITQQHILIKNRGKMLEKNFDEYLKPFNREYESIDKGLGLGLYITSNIIKKHGFKFHYTYDDNYHNFYITF